MDKLKIKDYIFITIPIVLMILVNIFCFVNHMTFVWKNPIDNVIFSSFPVSLLFPLLSFIFYKQTNDEKYRDKNEMVDPTDLRKTRLSTKSSQSLLPYDTPCRTSLSCKYLRLLRQLYHQRLSTLVLIQ